MTKEMGENEKKKGATNQSEQGDSIHSGKQRGGGKRGGKTGEKVSTGVKTLGMGKGQSITMFVQGERMRLHEKEENHKGYAPEGRGKVTFLQATDEDQQEGRKKIKRV